MLRYPSETWREWIALHSTGTRLLVNMFCCRQSAEALAWIKDCWNALPYNHCVCTNSDRSSLPNRWRRGDTFDRYPVLNCTWDFRTLSSSMVGHRIARTRWLFLQYFFLWLFLGNTCARWSRRLLYYSKRPFDRVDRDYEKNPKLLTYLRCLCLFQAQQIRS